MADFDALFLKALKKPLQQGVALREHSSFRIGGPARYFFEATTLEELKAAVLLCRQSGMPYYLVGGGYNLLFDDRGFDGLILKNSSRGISLKGEDRIETLAGTGLSDVVEFAVQHGLEGLEFLAGIPGTVGGAVFGNAGAFGRAIGEAVREATLLGADGGEVKVGADFFQFGYRRSVLRSRHEVLLGIVLGLKKGREADLRDCIAGYLELRKQKHPSWDKPSAGCYFKNPLLPDGSKVPAGKILEETGAKSLRRGEAAVSPAHCNFIINEGHASAADVLGLATELKKRVRDRYGLELEEEVIFLPADASMT